MKKRVLIPILVVTHLLCLAFGYGIGASRTAAVEEATAEPTTIPETTEATVPIEETTIPTEETEKATEETAAQNVPVYTPVATIPPATQPPATEPPATNPPATDPPETQPPTSQPPAQGGNQNISGETPED